MRFQVANGDTITAVLAGAKATINPSAVVVSDSAYGIGSDPVALNGTTAVTLFTGGLGRVVVNEISIFNSDTAAITVTLKWVVGGTTHIITKQTLQISDTLIVGSEGIHIIDTSGHVKGLATEDSVQVSGATVLFNVDGVAILSLSAGGLQDHGTQAVTATTGGGTTGLITAGARYVTVTSDSADKQISLPAATVGDRIRILVGSTGCELISAVAAHKVNDVTVGATNEAALTAANFYDCQYVATNTWVVVGYTKLGAVQAALIPDVL